MSDLAIRVQNLSKHYHIAVIQHDSLKDLLACGMRKFFHVHRGHRNQNPRDFWALKDVSFEVKHGEVVGIIGRNGAGKSTLLKILSRITQPTRGRAEIHGRVASLLEVGIGFHPELTGRDNIYLNGAILGMKKAEIEQRFDEIVDFSEIAEFIDTPVKRYSSGMYTRLAFAVAAHLEPEILIVDEVLAVGDVAFQKKCLGKMDEVAKAGRTVLFVSHDLPAISNLCPRAMLLDAGCLIANDTSEKAIAQYAQTIERVSSQPLDTRLDRKGNGILKFLACGLWSADGRPTKQVHSGQALTIALKYRCAEVKALRKVSVSISVHGRFSERLFHLSTSSQGFYFQEIPSSGTFLCRIPCLPLQPGVYTFDVICSVAREVADWVHNAGRIEVEAGDFFGSGKLPSSEQGPFLVQHSWNIASEYPDR
jgi:homopolymeric O-antigen transport system ATP-binding protein